MPAPDHFEVAPYPQGRFQNGSFHGERLVECAGTDVAALLDWFDTYPNDLWPYDFGGWSQSAMCVEAKVIPKPSTLVTSNSKPLMGYDKAWVYLQYSTASMFDVGGYRIWERLEPGLRHEGCDIVPWMRWMSDNALVFPNEAHLVKAIPSGEYRISHFKLAMAPSSLPNVWGKVNAGTYQTASLGYWFGAGTMLCVGATVERGSPGALTSNWKQAHYVFYIHPEGWNNVFRSQYSAFDAVKMPNGQPYFSQAPVGFTWTSLRF